MYLFRNLGVGAAALAAGLLFQAAASAQTSTLISQGDPVTSTGFYNQGTETFPASNITDGTFGDTGTPGNWSFWLTPNGQLGAATIDLGSQYAISSFQLQDTHNRAYYDRGTNAFDISVSTDGVNFTPVVSDAFSQSAWQNLSIVTENSFAPVTGEFVKFNIDSTYGSGIGSSGPGASGGLNELQVFGAPAAVPEASTTVSFGLLLMLGLAGMAVAKKRKQSAQA